MANFASFGYVGWSKQTVLGTPVAPARFARWSALASKPTMKTLFLRDGQNHDVAFSAKTQQWKTGTFSTYLYPDEFGSLLAYTLGATDGVSGMADPYIHTGSAPAAATPTPLTFEVAMGGTLNVSRVTDCYVTSLKVGSKAGDLVKVDVGWVGRLPVPGTSPATVTYTTDRPLEPPDATYAFTGLTVTGSTAAVTDLNFEIKQDIKVVPVSGSLTPQLVPAGREVMLDFTILAQDEKLWRDVYYGGDSATVAVVALTTLTSLVATWDIGGSPDHQLALTFNNVDATDVTPSFDPNGKEFTLQCKGQSKFSGGTTVLSYSIKNATAAIF